MSGGVDSAVAALLLKEQGYEVVGVTCQIWLSEICNIQSSKSCCGNEAVDDARETARALGIRHYVFNYRELFKEKVIDAFCDTYLQGSTPNPCMNCNLYIRSIDLLDRALAMGFDYMATGHYVINELNPESGEFELRKGVDSGKDQSYFLYQLSQEKLAHLLFPLGRLTKEEVRQIAVKAGIPVAQKAESQDICFVPDGDYGGFIEEYRGIKGRPAEILYRDGMSLGRGRPLYAYTIGQRKGLGIAWKEPLYVLEIRTDDNQVVVGESGWLGASGLIATQPFYLSVKGIPDKSLVLAKVRYRSRPSLARYRKKLDGFSLEFLEEANAVTKGQSVVLYHPEDPTLVLGGGRIESVLGKEQDHAEH